MPKTIPKSPKTETITFKVSPKLKSALKDAADSENRSVSNFIQAVLIKRLGIKEVEK